MKMSPDVEKYRVGSGPLATTAGESHGHFKIPRKHIMLTVVVTPKVAGEWEHVAVSLPSRTPTWEEANTVKNFFFGEDETVLQFLPKKSEYIATQPHTLHLWKKTGVDHELPPKITG